MSDDPAAIVHELQALTDIEGDLAETALAVAAPSSAVGKAAHQTNGDDIAPASALLQNAKAVEATLEQNIPPGPASEESTKEAQPITDTIPPTAPVPAPEDASSTAAPSMAADPGTSISEAQPAEQSSPPSTNADAPVPAPAQPSPAPASSTQPVADASEAAHAALDKVNADLTVPILPESVAAPAHDVQTETAIEEETSEIKVDVEEPTVENVVQAVHDSKDMDKQAEGGDVLPASAPPAPSAAAGLALNPVVSAAPGSGHSVGEELNLKKGLPEGLNESSPTVAGNPDLVRLYRSGSKDPNVVLSLFNAAVQRTEIRDARAWYEVLAVDNPTAIQPLLALINLELALSHFPQVEALFAKALKGPSGDVTSAADVSIWKAYLHYIRRQNPLSDGPSGDAARSTVAQAYEFALKECGHDRESGEIWQEYLGFLQDQAPKNTWEEQQRTDNLRKTYQRAVCIPLNNVEALWKAYDAFESGLNKLTAKKFLAEKSPAYMTARTALRELRTLTDPLPRPILPPQPTFSDEDRRAVAGWKAYLKWEEGNPLVMDEADGTLADRVGYAIRKCLGEMRHFPEMWHYAANYYLKSGKQDEAVNVLRAGVEACPKSILLTFFLAELEETLHNLPAVHTLFTTLADRLNPEIDELQSDISREVTSAMGPEIPAPPEGNGGDVEMNGDGGPTAEYERLKEEREERGRMVRERREREVKEVQEAVGVVWVMYMRFARRAEGVKSFRAVFGKSRKTPHLTWHIFEASAMIEYHSNKDSGVAVRIFELGWKQFADEVDYVVKYLGFLLSINDDTNARALFERSAVKIPANKARPLWDTWARYEYMYGDLTAVHKLEARFAEVFPNDSPLKRFAQRFTYNSIDQIAIRDLGFGVRARTAPAPAPAGSAPAASLPPHSSAPPPHQHHDHHAAQDPSALKRAHPDSPRHRAAPPRPPPRASHSPARSDRDRDRDYKRHRGPASPPSAQRRYPLPERERGRGDRDRYSRDKSPLPPLPPPHIPQRNERVPSGPPPPVPIGAGAPALDRSGLGRPLAWFIGNLPPARAFDGPVFRPDDIIGLFSNIGQNGLGGAPVPPAMAIGYGPPPPASSMGAPPPHHMARGPPSGGYADAGRGYPPPPPMRGGGRY